MSWIDDIENPLQHAAHVQAGVAKALRWVQEQRSLEEVSRWAGDGAHFFALRVYEQILMEVDSG